MRTGVVLFVAALQWASLASASEPVACPRADEPIAAGIEIIVPEGSKPQIDASVAIRNACKGGTLRRGFGVLSHVTRAEFLPGHPNRDPKVWVVGPQWQVCGTGRFAMRDPPGPRICTKTCYRGCLYFSDPWGGLMGMSRDSSAEPSCGEEKCQSLIGR